MNKETDMHTPGPWEIWTSCSWKRIKGKDGLNVCEPFVAVDGHPNMIINEANENLICAAPDLLECMQEEYTIISDAVESGRIETHHKIWLEGILSRMETAIKQAQGESS